VLGITGVWYTFAPPLKADGKHTSSILSVAGANALGATALGRGRTAPTSKVDYPPEQQSPAHASAHCGFGDLFGASTKASSAVHSEPT